MPEVFIGLFSGENTGKAIIKIYAEKHKLTFRNNFVT